MSNETSQRHAVILDAVRRLLRRGAQPHLANMLGKMHPAEVAKVVRHLEVAAEKRIIVNLVKNAEAKAEVLSELDPDSLLAVFPEIPRPEQLALLKDLSSDDAADLLGALPPELSQELIEQLPQSASGDVVELLGYPEETAGGIMTTDVFALPATLTAGEAIAELQRAADAEMVFYIYAVDEAGVLKGVLSLRELLTVPPATRLDRLMTTPVIRARVDMDQEEVARLTARYNLLALPVVDHDGKLVGVITVDDVIDVIRDEATEDMLKMSGTSVGREYSVTMGSMHAVRLRLPWLMVNVVGGIGSAWLMLQFTNLLHAVVALVTFIPLSMALGGSIGLQSSIIVVRGLATGRIEASDLRRVFIQEVQVGVVVGLMCGALVGAIASIWHDPWLGAVVGISLFLVCCVAVTLGTLSPLIFHRLHIDPAISSGPLVTMLNDVTGLLIYLTMATLLLVVLQPAYAS